MLVVLLGPPGAGKGTQAEQLIERYDLVYISTGDILRAAVKNKTELGRQAQQYLAQGRLVPDDLVADIVAERLQESDCSRGVLLDGFPRTVGQAHFLDGALAEMERSIGRVILIEVEEEELISRLTGRRVCRDCGSNYHVKHSPPQVRNVCDQCGGELYQREDDSLGTVKERLKVYREQTVPLIDYYRERGLLTALDGNTEVGQLFSQIASILEGLEGL